MAKVGPVVIDMHAVAHHPALRSVASVLDVLAASGGAFDALADSFPELVCTEGPDLSANLRSDAGDLIFGESILRTTVGTLEVALKPSDRYLELVAAISGNRDVSCDFDFHGWPILSLVGDTASMTEAGAASSRLGGGSEL